MKMMFLFALLRLQMSKIPSISGKDLVKALQKEGFEIVRQKGSHVSMKRG